MISDASAYEIAVVSLGDDAQDAVLWAHKWIDAAKYVLPLIVHNSFWLWTRAEADNGAPNDCESTICVPYSRR